MDLPRRGVLSILSDTFRGYRRYVLGLVILGTFGAALDGIGINAIVPMLSFLLGDGGVPTDFISQGIANVFGWFGVPFKFRYLLAFVAVLFVLRAIAIAISTYIRGIITASYMAREMNALFRATMRSRWQFIIGQKAAYIQNTIFWDIKRSTQLLDGVVQFVQSATGALMYLLIALNISPEITLLTLGVGAAILLILRRPLLWRSRTLGEETAVAEKKIAQHMVQYLQSFKMVKAAGATGGVVDEAKVYLESLRSAHAKSVFISGLSSVIMQPLSFLFIIGVFSFSYTTNTFNVAAFAATLYLIQKIFTYLDSTQSSFSMIVQLIPFAENVEAYKRVVAREREEEVHSGKPFVFERSLGFADVSFSYVEGTPVLSTISGNIQKGSMLGIIGASGGGKTSLADLLLRLFQPTAGTILLDDTDAKEIQLADWRRHVGYVSQDPYLVNASVADNIRFFDTNVSDQDIRRATKQAHIDEVIEALPQQYETMLGERGVTLSGGQRQRIALARALARKPQILVLDEVTSALDSELEKLIQQVIDELRGEMTLIVIAHRISTILSADVVWVLQGGTLTESGKPKEMIQDAASYLSRMIAMQGSGNTSEHA